MSIDYKIIDENDVEKIKDIINDDERVLWKEAIGEEYSHDELNTVRHQPDLVVRALSTEEISKIMEYSFENDIPVTARGAGTGLVGSAVAVEGGIILDLTLMDKILEIDEENLTLTVEPGVLLMNIAKFVEEHDLFYPPDPGEKTATIGGNISTNAGGMRAVKYGVTRDYVRGLEVVTPNGKIIEVGGKVVKNSSGYALKDLMIGSEGTLGIITKAILKLLPLPKSSLSILVPFNSLENAIGVVPEIIKSKAIPTAIEFMEKEIIKDAEEFLGKHFPDDNSNAYLLLTFDGANKSDVETQYKKVADICLNHGGIDAFISDTEERQEIVWKTREGFLEAVKASTSEMDEVDVVVPRNKIADFVKFTKEVREKVNIRIKSFGHAGDGNLHIYMLRDGLSEKEWHEKLEKAMELMYERAKSYGGKVSGEHAIGYAKREYLRESISVENIELMKGIKEVFDPKYILNPKKII